MKTIEIAEMNGKEPLLRCVFRLTMALLACLSALSADADDRMHRATSGAMRNGIENIGRQVDRYSHIEVDGCPFVAVQAGASICYGEFARVRANFPGMTGFTIMGGIGKEMIFDRDYKDRMAWHAGVGYYIAEPAWVVNLDVVAAKTPSISDVGILAQAEFNYFLRPSRRIGFFAGFGVGIGELDRDDPKKLWEVSLGVTFKLFSK